MITRLFKTLGIRSEDGKIWEIKGEKLDGIHDADAITAVTQQATVNVWKHLSKSRHHYQGLEKGRNNRLSNKEKRALRHPVNQGRWGIYRRNLHAVEKKTKSRRGRHMPKMRTRARRPRTHDLGMPRHTMGRYGRTPDTRAETEKHEQQAKMPLDTRTHTCGLGTRKEPTGRHAANNTGRATL